MIKTNPGVHFWVEALDDEQTTQLNFESAHFSAMTLRSVRSNELKSMSSIDLTQPGITFQGNEDEINAGYELIFKSQYGNITFETKKTNFKICQFTINL